MLAIPYTKLIPYPFEVVLDQYFDYEHIAHVHPDTLGEYVLLQDRGHVLEYEQRWPVDRRGRRATSRVVQTYKPPGDISFEFTAGKHCGTRVVTQLRPHPDGTEVRETYHVPYLPNWRVLRRLIGPMVVRAVERVWDEDLRVGVCIGGWPGIPGQRRKAVTEERRRPLPEGSYPVGKAEQFLPDTLTKVETPAGPVVVAHTPDGYRALHPTCPHTGGPLALGRLDGGCVECPWHAARFDLTTGRACGGPNKVPLTVYATAVIDGELVVSVNGGAT